MTPAEKKALSERDICTKFITPALIAADKWDVMGQVREEVYFTKGRLIVRGQLSTRGEPKRADYVLSYKPGKLLAEYQQLVKAVNDTRGN
jgi:type I restriction enzyme, R subunit